MDFDKKYGFSFLDGIPLKVSAAFVPPPPIVLPNVSNLDEELFLEKLQYDFSLEKKVLEDIKNKEKDVTSLPEANSNVCDKPQSNSNNSVNFSIPKMPSVQSEILLPKTENLINKVSNTDNDANSKINLSDFENDTSSPFDYMELQTINDLEELNSVFQGLNNKYNSDDNVYKEKMSLSSVTDEEKVTNSFCKSVSFPLQNSEGLDNSQKYLTSSKENTMHGFDAWHECPTSSPVNIQSDHKNENNSVRVFSRTLQSTVPKVPLSIKTNAETPLELESKPSLRGWKSSSDIHDLLEQPLENASKPERSCTPPAQMLSEVKSASPFHESDISSGTINCDNSSNFSGFPDPYDELSEDSRKFVDAVTDMGFPRGQVSRMVRHLGVDDKMVVEHLCQIQTLQESGYDCFEAEAALHLHDYNQDQAKEFLDMINKFQDLGFEKNAVKKALIQNKNDWCKTIDALLS